VRSLTIYAFSTENWGRPKDEVEGLMHILADVIDRELAELHEEGVQLRHIGRLERLEPVLRAKVERAINMTHANQRLTLCVAFNYGGRDEIVCALQQIMQAGIPPEEVTDELVDSYLFTAGVPDPDLIIRTSGEMRFSNFLLWQAAYAEWYVTPTLWPDFDKDELRRALDEYSQRKRRFGKILPEECQGEMEAGNG